MVRFILKFVGLMFSVQVILFVLMMSTAMSDESAPTISRGFYFLLKYILGLPLVLINTNYPFFLDSDKMPIIIFPFVAINNLLVALVYWWIFKRK